ncbi:MAG: Gfo/Idh/MocA family oxidoreductase [Chthoniobacter sp.]|nr:Gfo/Idh/MocA family oxidoreductase [Chthoniobacter sp.]
MNETYRAALIGCGKIGWEFQDDPGAARFGVCTHVAAWNALDNVRLVAVADAHSQKAQRCATRWQVPFAYQDVGELLRGAQPEIVSIATPDESHFSVARECLEYPSVRVVLVEKPLATTFAEASQLDALARSLGKIIVVNYSRRFCPVYQSVRRQIQTGSYGATQLARVVYTKGVRHNGSHALDLMQYWFGDVKLGDAQAPSWNAGADDCFDPPMNVTFSLPGRGEGMLHNLPYQQYTLFELDLCFESARLVFTDGGDVLETHTVVADQPFAGYRSLVRESRQEGCLRDYLLHACRHVAALLGGGVENLSSAAASISLLQEYETLLPV